MTLNEFKTLLETNRNKGFRLTLPDESAVPISFHITEVAFVQKTFIDCGGTMRENKTCQLQAWVGPDEDHRTASGKMASILDKAKAIVPNNFLELEIEYEDEVISQYTVADAVVSADAVTLHLAYKHTDCLARELCIVPAAASCAPGSGCC